MSLLKVAGTTAASGQLYVDSVFSTWLYTGNGATQTITNGIDLAGKGGLVWVKSRSPADNHQLIDTAQSSGSNAYHLNSNTTDASLLRTNSITGFLSSGFSVGGSATVNDTSVNYASWTFRKAAKFFDVVTYTGTGSARTIAHSLGVAPGMVIVKRTDTTGNWQVYHRSLTSAANSIQLNLTNAQASAPTVWNSTAPTSSVFSVGTDATVNASGGTYVAYLYAHDTSSTGIIQCGGFTTDASGVASISLGWEPQYLLYKNIDSAVRDWNIVDTMRGFTVSSAEIALYANSSQAESSYGNNKPTATGITFDGNASSKYIYMAIRRPNKPPTSGTQVYNGITRTGTGAAGVKVTGTGFTPDMSMISLRAGSTGEHGFIADRLRGTGVENYLHSSGANSETGDVPGFIAVLSLDMNGQSLANTNVYGTREYYNANTFTYIDWFFKRAPGFFDEVCYTGTGVATTQAHNLGVAPEMIITKQRSGTNNWFTYHATLGATNWVTLNLTNASTTSSAVWNDTAPTSTVFTVGTASNNTSGATLVAYLFATLAGISKVGSYTGNGTGQAIACGFSAGARFVLIKRADSTGDWYTFDSARGLTSGSSPYLLLNSTAAETTGNNGVYASTGGFTLGATASTTTNINAATYIFLAVA